MQRLLLDWLVCVRMTCMATEHVFPVLQQLVCDACLFAVSCAFGWLCAACPSAANHAGVACMISRPLCVHYFFLLRSVGVSLQLLRSVGLQPSACTVRWCCTNACRLARMHCANCTKVGALYGSYMYSCMDLCASFVACTPFVFACTTVLVCAVCARTAGVVLA